MAEGTVAADQLRLFIERIERLEEEKKGIADDVKDVYAEAKSNGYDPKIMRMIVRLRKMETHTRQEQDARARNLSQRARSRVRNSHGRPFQIQEHHASQGRAGQKALGDVLQAEPRNHRRGEDGPARSRHERRACAPRSSRPRRSRCPRTISSGRSTRPRGGDAENYEEIRYEGFGPGGVALIVEALSDNRNRTATNVRTAFSKNGGNLGASGSVSHGFERMGLIEYGAAAGDADKVLEAAIEAGADDVAVRRGRPRDLDLAWIRSTKSPRRSKARSARRKRSSSAGSPATEVEVRGDDAGTLMKLIDALEEDDDVQTVWGNYNVPDEELEKLA